MRCIPGGKIEEDMDILSPIQHRHTGRVWHRLWQHVRPSPHLRSCIEATQEPWSKLPISGAKGPLYALLLLNLPAPISALYTMVAARADARREWPKTFGARWIPSIFSSTRKSLLEQFEKDAIFAARRRWSGVWLLTGSSTRPDRWHTWITSNFVHLKPMHLLDNLLALSMFGNFVTKVPGINALHITAIVLGSSVFGSLAMIVEHNVISGTVNWAAGGTSTIASALGAIAAFGVPHERMHVGPLSIPVWAVITATFIADFWGWFEANPTAASKLLEVKPQRIGHVAHLAGAVFGAAYYFVALKRYAAKSAVEVEEKRQHIDSTTSEGIPVIDELDEGTEHSLMTPTDSEGEELELAVLDAEKRRKDHACG